MEYKAGLDIGSSSIKLVVMDESNKLIQKKTLQHHGNIVRGVLTVIKDVDENLPILITGSHADDFFEEKYILEDIPAIHKGGMTLCNTCNTIIDIGSQNGRIIGDFANGKPPVFAINESCAGGTGSFFEDQMHRLNCKLEDYSSLVEKASSIPTMSGRCSVFAKTDIIHKQQEGVDTNDILLGLCYATIRNFKVTVVKNIPVVPPVVLGGGVSYNKGVIQACKEVFSLKDDELFVSDDCSYIQAIGACMNASNAFTVKNAKEMLTKHIETHSENDEIKKLEPLVFTSDMDVFDPECKQITSKTEVFMGIDVGSTSTNLILMDKDCNLIDMQYMKTLGDPKQQVLKGFDTIVKKYGDLIEIIGVGVTGSGRYFIGETIGADCIKDEISAQAKCGAFYDPLVDTIFEIGGQDSKYISIEDQEVKDFTMNRICAAGTGSFLEEQAGLLDVKIQEYGAIAKQSKQPIDLGERCTVFIKTNISTAMSKGASKEDILAGLSHSIIRNYLFKVVEHRKVGNHILLQGGVCYNPSIVASFVSFYKDKVHVNPYFSISGAFGVALLTKQQMEKSKQPTNFYGFYLEKKNEAKVKQTKQTEDLMKVNDLIEQKKYDPNKKTVGIPMVLMNYKLAPIVQTLFESLGFNVIFSKSNNAIAAMSQANAVADTCYPVKLVYGHFAWLAVKQVDYIFMPRVETMAHDEPGCSRNFGCMYMQSSAKFVFDSMHLSDKGITLLSPQLYIKDKNFSMKQEFMKMVQSLGISKPKMMLAMANVAKKKQQLAKQQKQKLQEVSKRIATQEKQFVLVCRPYDAHDPILNMQIPQEFAKRGYTLIPHKMFIDPEHYSLNDDYQNLFWPFGKHLIKTARKVAQTKNTYAIYITNHGCGPDGMLLHLFEKEMGEKPYLHIEVDEHVSKVGVITRIEAFLNAIEQDDGTCVPYNKPNACSTSLKKDLDYGLYNIGMYSDAIASYFNTIGYHVHALKQSDASSFKVARTKILAKEYTNFIAMLASVLENKETNIIVPSNLGSESDGMYPDIIASMQQETQANITTFMIEDLLHSSYGFEIFSIILAIDLIQSLPNDLQPMYQSMDLTKKETILDLCNAIKQQTHKKPIYVFGEYTCVYNTYCNHDLKKRLHEEGFVLQLMALSEYLLCLTLKTYGKTKDLNRIVDLYETVVSLVGDVCNMSSMDDLLQVIQKETPHYTGGNICYRYAKRCVSMNVSAMIEVSSLYENTQTVLSMLENKNDIPYLCLQMEETNKEAVYEKLKSFLYYL